MAKRTYTEEKTMKRIAILKENEEVVVRGGQVFIKKKFDAYEWAEDFLYRNWTTMIDLTCVRKRVIVACDFAHPEEKPGIAICSADDEFNIVIGRAIAVARLLKKPLPKELFE